jgi:hypothetical protein
MTNEPQGELDPKEPRQYTKRKKKHYIRDDTTVQMRIPTSADQELDRIALKRGMVKKDLAGRIVKWFVDLHEDIQASILGHVSDEAALRILDSLRGQLQTRIVREGQKSSSAEKSNAQAMVRPVRKVPSRRQSRKSG